MRVNPTSNPVVQGTDLKSTESAKSNKSDKVKKSGYEGAPSNAVERSKSDSVKAEISTKAKELASDTAKATQLAKDAPDVREAKIAELREKIQNKKYNVSATDIADRLVDDHIRMAGA